MSLAWFLIVLIIVLDIQSRIFDRWGPRGLSYKRTFNTDAVFEGEEVQMVEQIRNKKLLLMPWLRIESKIDSDLQFQQSANLSIRHDEFHTSLFSLMPYTGITRRHRVFCKKRGCYRLNSVSLTFGDPFGVREKTKQLRLEAQLLVYPKILEFDQIPFVCRSWMGDIMVKRWIISDPFYVAGIRAYQPGDSLNRISWKASARLGDLLVNSYDHTSDPKAMIYLNLDIEEGMWRHVTDKELIERALSIAASMLAKLTDEGIAVGFASNGHLIDDKDEPVIILPQSGASQLTFILGNMAMMLIERVFTFYTFLESEIKRDTDPMDILIMTAFVSDRLENQIERLVEKGHSVEIFDLSLLDKGGEEPA